MRISHESLELDDMDELISDLNPASMCGKSARDEAQMETNQSALKPTVVPSEPMGAQSDRKIADIGLHLKGESKNAVTAQKATAKPSMAKPTTQVKPATSSVLQRPTSAHGPTTAANENKNSKNMVSYQSARQQHLNNKSHTKGVDEQKQVCDNQTEKASLSTQSAT